MRQNHVRPPNAHPAACLLLWPVLVALTPPDLRTVPTSLSEAAVWLLIAAAWRWLAHTPLSRVAATVALVAVWLAGVWRR